MTEPDLWMHTESTQHPLAHYHTLLTPAAHGHKREQPKWMVRQPVALRCQLPWPPAQVHRWLLCLLDKLLGAARAA